MRGPELRGMRIEAGLKAKELADELGIGYATLSRYENGHKDVPNLVQLAARYICEPRMEPSLSAGEKLVVALKEAIREPQEQMGQAPEVA